MPDMQALRTFILHGGLQETARCRRLPDTGLSAFAIRFGSCYNISYENMP